MSVPGPPQISIRPRTLNTSIRIWWSHPIDPGSSDITGFRVTSVEYPGIIVDCSANIYTTTITGLTNGTPYTMTIAALNDEGYGPVATYRTVQPGSKPTVASNLSATTDLSGSISMTWTGATTPNASILGYVVSAHPIDAAAETIRRSTFPGDRSYTLPVVPKKAYRVDVQAVNDPGYGSSILTAPITAFKPTDISGLNLWLDAADTATLFTADQVTPPPVRKTDDPVGLWRDKSGMGNDVSNGTYSKPTYSFTGMPTSYPSYPCVRFDVSGMSLTTTPMTLSSNNATIFIVSQIDSASIEIINGVGQIRSANSLMTIDFSYQYPYFSYRAPGISTPFSDIYFDTIISAVNIDSATTNLSLITPYTIPDVSGVRDAAIVLSTATTYVIGSVGTYMSEIIVYNGILSDPNQLAVSTYLFDKWGSSTYSTPAITSSIAYITSIAIEVVIEVTYDQFVFLVNGATHTSVRYQGIYYILYNLQTDTAYDISVYSTNPYGSSTTSEIAVSTYSAASPDPIGALSATGITSTTISFSWVGGDGADTSEWNVDDVIHVPSSIDYTLHTATITGLPAATQFNIHFIASNYSYNIHTASSPIITVTTLNQ